MTNNPAYRQYEIRWVRLDPTVGSETQKTRPCVILQQDIINQYSGTTIVAPLLKGHRERLYAVNVTRSRQNGLDQDRRLELLQIRAVDHSRILGKTGVLEPEYHSDVQKALNVVFGFYS